MITPETLGPARARIYQAAIRLFAENGRSEVTVSELAQAAGIARGTIYNNIDAPENLFSEVAAALSREMIWRVEATMRDIDDPAQRLATGLRLFIRRAHDDQDWARFIIRFSLSDGALHDMMREPPARDIAQAIEHGRFKTEKAKIPALISLMTGGLLGAMNAVVAGDQTWREAGESAAELFLRAAGATSAEARRLSKTDLPALEGAEMRADKRRKS